MTNKLKNKRGFSLVELMVVVAIMGTLASIAIPAFNEYRKSAKKASYRADLSSLHKGWLAFGVELDSFCERDTLPQDVSISVVGMESLRSSKLYGTRAAVGARCSPSTAGSNPADCVDSMVGSGAGTWLQAIPAGNGPGKHNFIGFGTETCTGATNLTDVQILGADIANVPTVAEIDCDLGVDTYEMGVYGHISGQDYFGISINNNGVLSQETIGRTGAASDASCS